MQICDVVLHPCALGDLDALEAWAPTGNSRTHEMRFSHQVAGTSTYYLAICRHDPDAFVGSCEIRWNGCAAPRLFQRLGYTDTGHDYLDRYTWIDETHQEHHVAEPARWMMKALDDTDLSVQ